MLTVPAYFTLCKQRQETGLQIYKFFVQNSQKVHIIRTFAGQTGKISRLLPARVLKLVDKHV